MDTFKTTRGYAARLSRSRRRFRLHCPCGDSAAQALRLAGRLPADAGRVQSAADRGVTAQGCAELALRESRQQLSNILEFLPYATVVVDSAGVVIAWNKAMENMTGISSGEMLGKGDYEYALPFYGRRRPILVNLALAPDVGLESGYECLEREGDILKGEAFAPRLGPQGAHLAVSAAILHDLTGGVVGAIECISDITEHKQAIDALRESEARYRSVIENIADVYYRTDECSRITMMSPSAMALLGCESLADLLGRPASSLWRNPEKRAELLSALYAEGEVRDYEVDLVRMDGSQVVVSTSSRLMRDAAGRVLGVEGILRDVTARKHMEQALHESEKRASDIIDFAPDATFVIDLQGKVIAWNRAIEEMTGVGAQHMVGKGDYEYSLPFYGTRRPILIDLVFLPSEEIVSKYHFVKRRGECLVAEADVPVRGVPTALWGIASPLYNSAGEIIGAIESIRDISEFKKVEDMLRNTRNMYNSILESMPSAIIGLNEAGLVTHWNKGAAQLFGRAGQDVLGRPLAQASPLLGERFGPGRFTPDRESRRLVEVECGGYPGERQFFDVMVYPLEGTGSKGAVLRVDDTTQRVRMEQMLVQTEKMMSVGGLAAGMAHEINNPLSGILQGVQNVMRRLSPGLDANDAAAKATGCDLQVLQNYLRERQVMELLAIVQQSGERAAKIVSNMLSFARRAQDAREPTRLDELLDRSLELASTDYDLKKKYDFRRIVITKEYEPNVAPVPCSPMEIEQVILNLLRNAAQAMFASPRPDEAPRIVLRLRSQKDMAVIEVEDNGPGMREEDKRKVFEPFFTTKPPGEGTGLGLSVAYFIVTTAHKGAFEVSSQPGAGTCFTIRLPFHGAGQCLGDDSPQELGD